MKRILPYFLILPLVFTGCNREPEPAGPGEVIILMYHRITTGEPGNLYERSAEDFENDLLWLIDNNVTVIDFEELEKIVSGEIKLSGDAAILTFDDGDHSWYTVAVPLLKQYRMKATFFLWTSKVGMNSFLTWDEVALISRYRDSKGEKPFSFGSHTASHQYLLAKKSVLGAGNAYDAYLDEEFGGSKLLIESQTDNSVTALALPFGQGAGDPDIIAGAQRNGYLFIRTSERKVTGSPATDFYRLPSLPILNDTPADLIGDYLGIK
jgi:peptidoglycan/xylan/chitin deacetylase (PgdA/CDA1 family)